MLTVTSSVMLSTYELFSVDCLFHTFILVISAQSLPLLSQRCARFRCHNAVLVFAVTTLYSFSLSQRCARFRCHSAVLVFAVTTLYSFSLSQRCTRFRCHNAVLVFAVTTLCSFSLSQRCAHRCPTAVGFLMCTPSQNAITVRVSCPVIGCKMRENVEK